MKKKLILALCLCSVSIFGQQLPLFTYYREHHAFINPGAVYYENYTNSSAHNLSVGSSYRHQWANVRDAPKTITAQFEHILSDKNMLYGMAFIRDAIGLTDLTGGYLRYAYQIRSEMYPNSFISGGLNFGFFQYRYQPWKGIVRDNTDVLALTKSQQSIFDISAGLFMGNALRNDDVLYFGASVPQLLTTHVSSEANGSLKRYQHYYFLMGYYHFFSDDSNLTFRSFIEPSLWVRFVPHIPLQIDANIRVNMGQFWVGSGLAMSPSSKLNVDIIHGEVGVRLNVGGDYNILKIGYGFDITTNNASIKLGRTHEINIVYSWVK